MLSSRILRSSAAAAARSVPAFAFDIDGVLLKSGNPIPGAKEALHKVRDMGIPHVYLTNGGGVRESLKAQQLSDIFSLPIDPEQVVLSHTPLRAASALYADKVVCVVGMRDCSDVAKSYGFKRIVTPEDFRRRFGSLAAPHTSLDPAHFPCPAAGTGRRPDGSDEIDELSAALGEVAAVLVLHDPRDWYVDLQLCLDILLAGRPTPPGNAGASGVFLPQDPEHQAAAAAAATAAAEAGAVTASAPFCGAPHLHTDASRLYSVSQALRGTYRPKHTPLFLSNPDLLYSARFPRPRLAQGAFTEALGYLYSRISGEALSPVVCGKPTATTYSFAEGLLRAQAASAGTEITRVYGVGDNPAADIEGANRAGDQWQSVFVRTGSIPLSSHPLQQPDHNFADVGAAVSDLLRAHGFE